MSVIAALSDGTTRIVPIDGVDSVSALVGTLREALALPHPAEAYDVYVGAEGEEEVVAERACDLAEAGVVGCEERVTLRVRGEYVAREELRAEGVETAEGAVTALLSAMDAGDVERVRRVAAAGWTGVGQFVERAVREGNREVVEALLKTCGSGEEVGLNERLCELCCQQRDPDAPRCRASIATLLLDSGAEATTTDYDGQTPLATACWRGHVDLVRLLLERGADVNARDSCRATPLHSACCDVNTEVVAILLAHGADATAQTSDGATPLHQLCWSFRSGRVGPAALLVAAGADVNATNQHGETALSLAPWTGEVELAKLLVESGATINAAVLRSAQLNRNEVVEYLVEKGGLTLPS